MASKEMLSSEDYLSMNLSTESTKQLLERLLNTKSKRLTIKSNDKGKNRMIWSQFDIAYLDGIEQQYACCRFCKNFVKYVGRTGTGGLMRHFCYKQLVNAKVDEKTAAETVMETPYYSSMECEPVPLRLQIETLMHQKSPRIGYIPNYKGKSGVWSQFYMITLDNEVVNFACCVSCRSIVTYVSRTGTGSMTRHKCQRIRPYRKLLENVGSEDFPPPSKSKRILEDADNYARVQVKTEDPDDWEVRELAEVGEDVIVDAEVDEDEDSSSPVPMHSDSKSLATYIFEKIDRIDKIDQNQRGPGENIIPEVEQNVKGKHLTFLKTSLNFLDLSQNPEFLEFAQALIDLGAEYGKVDAKKIFKEKTDLFDLLKNIIETK